MPRKSHFTYFIVSPSIAINRRLYVKHCQHYVETYVKISRDLTSSHQILFYAVSCAVHNVICSQQEVAGYPTVKYFPPNQAKGVDIHHRESAKSILEDIESSLGKNMVETTKAYVPVVSIKETVTATDLVEKRDILISSRVSTVVEDQTIIYSDAETSFRFALRYSILSDSNHRMSDQGRLSLRSWLELLSKTLPKNETMESTHTLIHILLDNFEKVVAGDSDFISNFFVNMGETFHWSSYCSHNSNLAGAGYTCGLWHLFHLMTIGLVEWNKHVSIGERIPTIDAAFTLRNYVEQFFACDECRKNFLEMYDSCSFDHCHLLTGSISVSDDWEQLSLWLQEVHNDVRVRTFTEALLRQGLPPPTVDEIQSVKWPPRDKCPECWSDNYSASLPPISNKLETFEFMRKVMWSSSDNTGERSTNYGSIFAIFVTITFFAFALRSKQRFLHVKAF